MAARVVGIRQEGVNPCRMVPSMRGEVHVQLHDVTGKVQRAGPCIAVQMHDVRVTALDAHLNKKNELIWKTKSKPRFRVNRIPRSGVKRPPGLGTGIQLVRGMG